MQRDYWIKRWEENRIGFHRAGVNPLLERFLPENLRGPGRALVPLCGKSADLLWLTQRGYDVTGVELSEIAVRAFLSEHHLKAEVARVPSFQIYRADRLQLYVGDVFDLDAAEAGLFDLIYDRAALIALPPDTRVRYARHLQSLMAPGGTLFLISLEYNPAEMTGPPFTVHEPEIRALFNGWSFKKLHAHDCLDEEPHFRERGLTAMAETVYVVGGF